MWTECLTSVKSSHLKNIKVFLRVPDLKDDLPKTSGGAPLDWSVAKVALTAKVQTEFSKMITSSLGVTPKLLVSPTGAASRDEEDTGTTEVSKMAAAETKACIVEMKTKFPNLHQSTNRNLRSSCS